jgi:hypothetical protein
LIALTRNQVVPEVVLPAQVVRQRPPPTLATTDTLVPVVMSFRILELIEAPVRRFVLHSATFVAVAPMTSPGKETEATANSSIADRNAVTRSVGRAGRLVRRAGADKTGTSSWQEPELRPPPALGTMTRRGQTPPGPMGHGSWDS